MMDEQEQRYQDFWANYRSACPEVEASANFMPSLWDKIERRRSVGTRLRIFTQGFVTAAVCLCLILAALSSSITNPNTSYLDMLAAYHANDNPLVLEDGDSN